MITFQIFVLILGGIGLIYSIWQGVKLNRAARTLRERRLKKGAYYVVLTVEELSTFSRPVEKRKKHVKQEYQAVASYAEAEYEY